MEDAIRGRSILCSAADAILSYPFVPATEKTFLTVPYQEKEQAKKLGAKWDKEKKLWFAPEGVEPWNKGVDLAQRAAQEFGGKVMVPIFTDEERAKG